MVVVWIRLRLLFPATYVRRKIGLCEGVRRIDAFSDGQPRAFLQLEIQLRSESSQLANTHQKLF